MDLLNRPLTGNADVAERQDFTFEKWAQEFRTTQRDKYEKMQREEHRAKREETDRKYHRYLLGILLVEVAVIVVSALVSL